MGHAIGMGRWACGSRHARRLSSALEEEDAVREEEHQPPEEEHAEGQQDVEDGVVVPRRVEAAAAHVGVEDNSLGELCRRWRELEEGGAGWE